MNKIHNDKIYNNCGQETSTKIIYSRSHGGHPGTIHNKITNYITKELNKSTYIECNILLLIEGIYYTDIGIFCNYFK